MSLIRLLHDFLWGMPGVLLLLGAGILLTVRTGIPQVRLFGVSIRKFFAVQDAKNEDSESMRRSLFTALAGTVGTGNLVGVAGAICLGGPGSIFWMWLCGFFGMATKYAEAALSVRYRLKVDDGYTGGPMYVISRGMGHKWKPMADLFCIMCILASFGIGGMVQSNTISNGIACIAHVLGSEVSAFGCVLVGVFTALAYIATVSRGARYIGRVSSMLVPLAAGGYVLLCVSFLFFRIRLVPRALVLIFRGAFSPETATGGFIGGFMLSARVGCRRGVFSNEAGMGTAAIAHALGTSNPVEQGMMGLLEVFMDTMVICTLTAFVILTSGIPIPYGFDRGFSVLIASFTSCFGPSACIFLSMCLILLGFATTIGWGIYGKQCICFLLGEGAEGLYLCLQAISLVFGAVNRPDLVWVLAETANALMMFPNLIALFAQSGELRILTKDYLSGGGSARGGTYANIHKCKPL